MLFANIYGFAWNQVRLDNNLCYAKERCAYNDKSWMKSFTVGLFWAKVISKVVLANRVVKTSGWLSKHSKSNATNINITFLILVRLKRVNLLSAQNALNGESTAFGNRLNFVRPKFRLNDYIMSNSEIFILPILVILFIT